MRLVSLLLVLLLLVSKQACSPNCFFTDDAYGRLTWSLTPTNSTEYTFSLALESLEDTCLGVAFISDQDGIDTNFEGLIHKNSSGLAPEAKHIMYCYHQKDFGEERLKNPLFFGCYEQTCSGKDTTYLEVLVNETSWSYRPIILRNHFSTELRAVFLNMTIAPNVVLSFFVFPWGWFFSEPKDYYYVKLFNSTDNRPNHFWHPECEANYYRNRSVYYIWRLISFVINTPLSIVLFFSLFFIRTNYYVVSRSVVPYVSCIAVLLHNSVNITISALYAESIYDTAFINFAVVVVFSMHIVQIVRYFICRIVYTRTGNRYVNSFWFKALFSRVTPIVVVVIIIIVESTLFALLLSFFDYVVIIDYVVIASFAIMFLVAVSGIVFYTIQNRKTLKKLASPSKILRWYFFYDDTFRYHGELLIITLTLLSGLMSWVLGAINGEYLSKLPFLPIAKMNVSHNIGYALYGISKIVFETLFVAFEPAYLLLIYLIEKNMKVEHVNDDELENEIAVFLATSFSDLKCTDLMRRYLMNEFRTELLDLYLYIQKNAQFNPASISETFPFNHGLIFEEGAINYKDDVDLWRVRFIDLVRKNMFAAYLRLKKTMVYQKEYVERKKQESNFILQQIG